MSRTLARLVERQILKALAEGTLDNLEGSGKPLPDRSGKAFTDMATRVAVRIMAEAGALPEEFRLKKNCSIGATGLQDGRERRATAAGDGPDRGVRTTLQRGRRGASQIHGAVAGPKRGVQAVRLVSEMVAHRRSLTTSH